jgi:hypothetical protein
VGSFVIFLQKKRKISAWWVQTRHYCNILIETRSEAI